VVDITLNIGLGTFRPVKVQDTKDHVMHSETFTVSQEAADTLNKAKSEGRRIIAIGTTSVRTLEAEFAKEGHFYPTEEEATAIFIQPGYAYKAVDALITNFHLPEEHLGDARQRLHGKEMDPSLLPRGDPREVPFLLLRRCDVHLRRLRLFP
jgi:S-adenosylmethionine:tRNA ribosyltransferase-isomerase